MRRQVRYVKLFLLCVLLCLPLLQLKAEVPVPALADRVIDLTATLNQTELDSLRSQLKDFEDKHGSQIVILMLPTTDGEAIEDFSMRVAEAWKIGRKSIDDGIIITVAKDDRRMRIEVGYGLEGAVTDVASHRIIDEQMKPEFRADNFYGGLKSAVTSIIGLIEGEDLPPAKVTDDSSDALLTGIIVATFLTSFLLHFFIPTFIAVLIATVEHILLQLFLNPQGYSDFTSTLVIGLIMAFLGVTWYRFGGSGSGSGGGYSSGGGGGGGYSGGGGSFGGGGSSGSW